jgi:hypothetical protein
MGKPTGFIEYLRELPADRTPLERVGDWKEFHHHMEEKKLRQQGARCMDCGVPFCHTGKLISGMASGCPINNLIPEWNDLVYRGLWREALDRLHKTNNFPEFTGRVCPAPCEGSCVLGINAPAGHDQEHRELDHRPGLGARAGSSPSRPKLRTGKKVAVIGSGPAGLAAAAQLNRAGHSVTVFERADRPGGLLMYGIPNMKLDKKEVVLRRIRLMEEEGIKFICNANVGDNVEPQIFLKEYNATVICTGATQPRDLPIEGARPEGRPLRDGVPDRQHKASCSTATPTGPHPRARQGRRRDRRRRHRHRLRRHRHAPRLQEPVQIEILPQPPLERAPTTPGRSGPRSTRWTTARRRPPPVRRRPAGLPDHREEVRRRRRGPPQGARDRRDQVGEEREGPVHPEGAGPAPRRCGPRSSCSWRWASSGPSRRSSRRWASSATPAATSRPSTRSTRRAFRECSRPATAAAARAWSSGPSTRAAARECARVRPLPDGRPQRAGRATAGRAGTTVTTVAVESPSRARSPASPGPRQGRPRSGSSCRTCPRPGSPRSSPPRGSPGRPRSAGQARPQAGK